MSNVTGDSISPWDNIDNVYPTYYFVQQYFYKEI